MIAASALSAELTRLALCWRLARVDGVTLGFTGHDTELTIGGVEFQPTPALRDTKVELNDGVAPDAVDVSGALAAAAVTARDLDAGRWTGAVCTLFVVDWADPRAGVQPIAEGTLGDVERGESDGTFSARLVSAAARLAVDAAPACSPGCRASLGDDRCRVDMNGRSRDVTVVHAGDGVLVVDQDVGGEFAHGRLRVLSGAAAGLDATMLGVAAGAVQLLPSLRAAPAPGDRVRLSEGCDRRFTTCSTRFGNALNFRGEPFVPGTDTVIRYGDG